MMRSRSPDLRQELRRTNEVQPCILYVCLFRVNIRCYSVYVYTYWCVYVCVTGREIAAVNMPTFLSPVLSTSPHLRSLSHGAEQRGVGKAFLFHFHLSGFAHHS